MKWLPNSPCSCQQHKWTGWRELLHTKNRLHSSGELLWNSLFSYNAYLSHAFLNWLSHHHVPTRTSLFTTFFLFRSKWLTQKLFFCSSGIFVSTAKLTLTVKKINLLFITISMILKMWLFNYFDFFDAMTEIDLFCTYCHLLHGSSSCFYERLEPWTCVCMCVCVCVCVCVSRMHTSHEGLCSTVS